MIRLRIHFLPAALGLSLTVGALPSAFAVVYDLSYVDVVNSPPNCGSQQNCSVSELAKVTCPTGQVPTGVTVTLLNAKMDTNLAAQNVTDAPICYNAIDINHQFLRLSIDETNAPTDLNGPGDRQRIGRHHRPFRWVRARFQQPTIPFLRAVGRHSQPIPHAADVKKHTISANLCLRRPGI